MNAQEQTQFRWNHVAKPLNSLGKLEQLVVQIAGIQQTADVCINKRCALICCGDHGVVAEGVSQSGSEVTALVAQSIVTGTANINLMASVSGTDVYALDFGMVTPVMGTIDCRIAAGTRNMAREPAMTRAQAEQAVQAGIDAVARMKDQGYQLIATGEMGIGNTTASTAMACALLCCSPEDITGRGAGLSDAGLQRKKAAIQRALSINRPNADDALDVLAKVGGFEIAGRTAPSPADCHRRCDFGSRGTHGSTHRPGIKIRHAPLAHEPRASRGAHHVGIGHVPHHLRRYGAGRRHRRGVADSPAGYGAQGLPRAAHIRRIGHFGLRATGGQSMIVLVTGGSGCGKSTWAEKLVSALPAEKRVYIATMQVYDEESVQRVARHRAQRADKGFTTIECEKDLASADVPEGSVVLLEDLVNLMANEMFGGGNTSRILPALNALACKCQHLILVTNDVFSDGIHYPDSTREYLRQLAKINAEAAKMADCVVEVVYSIPVCVKGALPCV